MNILLVGSEKLPILDHLPDTFLFIDDKIDLPRPKRKNKQLAALIESVTVFDVTKDSFNPLDGIDHNKARDFAALVYAASPQGANTLTVRNGKRALTRMLLKAKSLDHLPTIDHEGADEAQATIDDLLLSPTLKHVLTRPTNFSFKGTILAKLDRAVLGEFDCFVIANLLISQYKGTVVIPDFGFYHVPSHSTLLRQNRLIAGINTFQEVPLLKQRLLQVEKKMPSRATPEDAEILAVYEGLAPSTNAYNDYIHHAIGGH